MIRADSREWLGACGGIDALEVEAKPLFERLEVVWDLERRSGAWNMAIDEILLGRLGGEPVLRLYDWQRPTVSFGCFGAVSAARDAAPGRPLVRRWTGGGIVEHDSDVTYSLVVPQGESLVTIGGGAGSSSYRIIHGMVAEALRRCGGKDAVFSAESAEPQTGTLNVADSGRCFRHPVKHDLLVAGQKIAGAAQRRTRAGLLHQGSVRNPRGPNDPGHDSWRDSFRAALPAVFGRAVVPRTLKSEELTAAAALVGLKYGCAEWLERF